MEIRERVYFEQSRDVIYPDATLHRRRPAAPSASSAAVLTADEPTILRTETRQRESFLEILSVGSREVVTVIEFISPAHKYGAGQGREEYRDKQEQVLGSAASLVEIDLLRRGLPVVVAPPGELLTLPRFDDQACVSRAGDRAQVEVYAVTLRERLPRISIPPREPDPGCPLGGSCWACRRSSPSPTTMVPMPSASTMTRRWSRSARTTRPGPTHSCGKPACGARAAARCRRPGIGTPEFPEHP
jgi:hypothetical protein